MKSCNIKKIKKYTMYSIPVCILPAIIGYLLPSSVYEWFLGKEYGNSKYFIVIYLIGYGINLPYLMFVNYFFYMGKSWIISIASFVTSVIYIFILIYTSNLSIELVPYSLIISNIVLVLILWRYMK